MRYDVVADVSIWNVFGSNKISLLERNERCNKKRQRKNKMYDVISNNERTEAQFISGIVSLKKTCITYIGYIAGILVFGSVYATTDIVWQDTAPLNF